jgi:hypothetical protein
LLAHREIFAVNRKVSDAERISSSFMYPGKMRKIKAEYKRLYPTGKVGDLAGEVAGCDASLSW